MLSELRHTLRSLARAPGFTATYILTLGLGIGVATAVFRQAEQVLFPSTSLPSPESLVVIERFSQTRKQAIAPFPADVVAWREHSRSFLGFAALMRESQMVVVNDEPMPVAVARVAPDYFGVLGIIPAAGRTFLPDEQNPGADRCVMLSSPASVQWFGGAEAALDQEILVGGERCRVVGVLPSDFRPPDGHPALRVYRPGSLAIDPQRAMLSAYTLARLGPGVTHAQAQAELESIEVPPPAARYASNFANRAVVLRPPSIVSSADRVRQQYVNIGMVGLLFGISLVSALNLALARVVGRQREFAVRLVLGGSGRRLARMLAAESIVLTGTAGCAGLLFSHWLGPVLTRVVSEDVGPALPMAWSIQPFAFAGGISLLAALLITWVTARRADRSNLNESLQHATTIVGDGRAQKGLRSVLIVSQVSLAVVLLASTGLLLRSVHRLHTVDLGFATENRYIVHTQSVSPRVRIGDPGLDQLRQLAVDTLQSLPGVAAVAFHPTSYATTGQEGRIRPLDRHAEEAHDVRLVAMVPGYRAALAIPLRAGRDAAAFRKGSVPELVVNESLANALFGSAAGAIGRTVEMIHLSNQRSTAEIVGVAGDFWPGDPRRRLEPTVYYQDGSLSIYHLGGSYVLRLNGPAPQDFERQVKQALYQVSPHLGVLSAASLEAESRRFAARERQACNLLRIVASLSLALTVLGVFAVMSHAIARQRAEFGLRLALGATPDGLFRLVIGRGLKLTLCGVAIGSVAATGLSRFIASLLYDTKPYDPLVHFSVAMLLVAAALVACWFPARLAMRANPSELLRIG